MKASGSSRSVRRGALAPTCILALLAAAGCTTTQSEDPRLALLLTELGSADAGPAAPIVPVAAAPLPAADRAFPAPTNAAKPFDPIAPISTPPAAGKPVDLTPATSAAAIALASTTPGSAFTTASSETPDLTTRAGAQPAPHLVSRTNDRSSRILASPQLAGAEGSPAAAGQGRGAAFSGLFASRPTAATPTQAQSRIATLAAAYRAEPGDKSASMTYAAALRTVGRNDEAAAVLQQAAIRSPTDKEILAAYGKALVVVGQLDEAERVLQRSHTRDAPNWQVLSALGTIAAQKGDPQTARRFYQHALQINPNDPGVMTNLALSYAIAGQMLQAEELLSQAAANPRADPRVRQNYAVVLAIQGKYEDAYTVMLADMSADQAARNIDDMKRGSVRPRLSDRAGQPRSG